MRKSEVWTPYRKLMANLVPALFFVPVFACGLIVYQRGQNVLGVVLMAVAPIVGMFAVNRFGLFQNEQMKRELSALAPQSDALFVGVGKPGSIGALDPHHDVGWLLLQPESLEFVGEKAHFEIRKSEVVGIRYRPNAHSILGLGRWISVEARRDGKALRMLIEPRKFSTHLLNRKEGARLMATIKKWAA